jgi:hypothetical protein
MITRGTSGDRVDTLLGGLRLPRVLIALLPIAENRN